VKENLIQTRIASGVARTYTFWQEDPVGEMLTFLCQPRPWDNKIVAIANNAKAFHLHFILNRAIIMKWQPELIMNGNYDYVYQNGTSDFLRHRINPAKSVT
jgi:hypothetical protein